MKYRKMGTSDIEVSVIGQGTWAFGGDFFGDVDAELAIKAIHKSIELGVNLVDTAPAYREITVAPHPDRRLGFAEASIDSRNGTVRVPWYYKGDTVCYELEIPQGSTAHLTLPSGKQYTLTGGNYLFAE